MRTITSIAAAACVAAFGGCAASASPQWDAGFGDSARTLKAQQLLDPAAPQRHAQQVLRGDGRTVHEAGERHVETYRNPAPANVINIGVGGGTSR